MGDKAAQPDDAVDIESVMRQVRAEVLAKRAGRTAITPIGPATGRGRLSPEFYEELLQAELAFNASGLLLDITEVRLPLLAPLIQKLRRKFHELVLFYVNKRAAEQATFNRHLLNALQLLSQELERMPENQEAP